MSISIEWWVIFNVLVVGMLAVDLGVFHRRGHVDSLRAAIGWSIFWVILALLFNVALYFMWPTPVAPDDDTPGKAALAFFTGYVIERALSIDNLFVFIILFRYFQVPARYHYRVLFWGVIGAIILRAIFIAAGVTLINTFHWAVYVFGAFLIYTGIKMAFSKGTEVHPERNPVLKLARRYLPLTPSYVEDRFFVRMEGRRLATPMFIVVLVVATTDLVFALDSIPAILAITTNAFIVYSSNVFAILGLRALYFVLAGVMELFHYLSVGLSAVLIFVGVKMVVEAGWNFEVPIPISLGVVAAILTVAVVASLLKPHKPAAPSAPTISDAEL